MRLSLISSTSLTAAALVLVISKVMVPASTLSSVAFQP